MKTRKNTATTIAAIINTFASANRFEVEFYDSSNITQDLTVIALKGCELPSMERIMTEKVWQGIKYPIAREMAYKNTTEMTFYLREDGLREEFLEWLYDRTKAFPHKTETYYQDIKLSQFKNSGENDDNVPNQVYTLHNAFPSEVGPVTLSSDNNGILEFTVTFSFSSFTFNKK